MELACDRRSLRRRALKLREAPEASQNSGSLEAPLRLIEHRTSIKGPEPCAPDLSAGIESRRENFAAF